MSDYTKKFTVVIKKDGFIKSVVNVIGEYNEVESMAHDILDDEGYTFEIIKDQDVFDIVYHFEEILENIGDEAYLQFAKIRNANKFKGDFEDYDQ
jgi:hypothetical protein